MPMNAADLLIDTLIDWGVDTIFGLPGDGINGLMEALRTRQERIRFIQARHEQAAAFMAVGYAKWTGKLGCCLATTGPGGLNLLTGLYDAKFDRVPVIAVTGLPYHDLIDTFTQQDVDHTKVFMDATVYSARIMGPAHVENVVGLACRMALARRGAAIVSIPIDVQEKPVAHTRSPRNVAHHVSFASAETTRAPEPVALSQAVDILNAGSKIVILAGQGALGAQDELLKLADKLGAPIIKALLGKAVVPDDHPLTTGGIGLLGTRPSQEAMEECDTLLIVGSSFPYIEYYPKPGQARAIQIDLDGSRIGLRYSAEVALVGSAKATLQRLEDHVDPHTDRHFLHTSQSRMSEWRRLLQEGANRTGVPMTPQRIVRDISDHLPDNAVVTTDSGHHTGLCARYVEMRKDNLFAVSGGLASMACGLPYAIAAALAFPQRPVAAIVGDGGLSMCLAELATVKRYQLPIKIVVLKNNTLGQIKWEQMMFLGNPEFECALEPIDFSKVAEAVGIKSLRIDDPEQSGENIAAAFAAPGPVLVEAVIDPNEPLLPPKRMRKYVENMSRALAQGTPGKSDIERSLSREPFHTMWTS